MTMKYWLLVIMAACFEVGWVIGLKHAASTMEWALTIICIIVSFGVLIYAGRFIPVGTVYAVFVGLGTVGTVVMDMVLFGAPIRPLVLVFIATLLLGVIGLKLATPDEKEVA